jgi:phage tail-like protein
VPAEPYLLESTLEPLATFRFALDLGKSRSWSGIFTECKLPDVEWDVQQLKEGGQNTYVHQLLGQRKPAQVTLKYGLTKRRELLDWYAEVMAEDFKSVAQTVTVSLLDSTGKPVLLWNLHNAYPVKVTWPEFKAGDNAVAILSLTLACSRVEFDQNP